MFKHIKQFFIKTILILYSVLFFSFASFNDTPVDRLGVKGPLEFNHTNFNLAWSSHPIDIQYIQEYLPDGENVESFNQMLSIFLVKTNKNVKDAVELKVNELIERKKTDKICNYKVSTSPDEKEFIIDFLVGDNKDNKLILVEFNVYKYKQINVSINEKALIIYTYSKRGYGNDITSFLNALENDRVNYINQMINTDIPKITIENK